MLEKPLLSIIIPTFNSANTVSACLQSLTNQTFRDFEVLVLDGKSKDATLSIVQSFADVLPSLKVVSEPDKGVYDAMNKGVKLAKGEWLYFLGSDDCLLDPNVLESIFLSNVISSADIVYGDVLHESMGRIYDGEFDVSKIQSQNICHQALFVKKSVFDTIGYFDLKYPMMADFDHNLRWFFDKRFIKSYVNVVVANYSDGGLSSSQRDEVFLNDRIVKIIEYGWNTLQTSELYGLVQQQIALFRRDDNKLGVFKYQILFYILLVREKMKGIRRSLGATSFI